MVVDVVDPASLAAELKHIALASYLCVPLIARGRTLARSRCSRASRAVASGLRRRSSPSSWPAGRRWPSTTPACYRDAELAASRERRRSEQLLRLSHAALLVNASTDLDELLAVLTAHAREMVGAARAVTKVARGDDDEPAVTAIAAEGSAAPGAPVLTAQLVARDGSTLSSIELVGAEGHRTGRGRGDSRSARPDGIGCVETSGS